jgi:hypothetical protein
MPEDIEASLNWPETGLLGVPESDNGLVSPAVPPAKHAAGGNGAASKVEEPEESAPPESSVRSPLEEDIAVLAQSVQQLAEAAAAARVDDAHDGTAGTVDETLGQAEETLRRLETAADDIARKLVTVNALLDKRARGLRAPLTFGSSTLDEDPTLVVETEFKGGIRGIIAEGGVVHADAGGAAVTWPPWQPPHKISMWSRFTRSNIAVPLLLIAVIAVAGATYKVVKKTTAPPPVAGVSQAGISAYGSVKVIAGPTCRAGTTTATVQLAAAQERDGSYLVSIAGALSNRATGDLKNVVVGWSVTYADGYTAQERAPIVGGTVPGKSTKTFYELAPHTDGSVPPASVTVTGIGATPVQAACVYVTR